MLSAARTTMALVMTGSAMLGFGGFHMKVKPEKPEVKFYEELLVHVLLDTAEDLGLSLARHKRDVKTLRRRLEAGDGMAFLTRTLPALGKSLDTALAKDEPICFPDEFRKTAWVVRDYTWSGSDNIEPRDVELMIPVFLQDYWMIVLDPATAKVEVPMDYRKRPGMDAAAAARQIAGRNLGDLEARQLLVTRAVRAIRQICFLAYKLEGSYPAEAEALLYEKFRTVDRSLPSEEDVDEIDGLSYSTHRALEIARYAVWAVMRGFTPHEGLSRHGRGAVATGERAHQKFNFRRLFETVESEYPFVDNFLFNYSHLCYELESLEDIEVHPEPIAKMQAVEKDSRGPRLISMEPLELQWLQQGEGRALMKHIERHNLTAGHVNFTNQQVNRDLALSSSKSQQVFEDSEGVLHVSHTLDPWITIDLEDASDRVSVWLVKQLFDTVHFRAFNALRSRCTLMPDGHVQVLRKFAPMGSALCFPVESLVFWALAVGATHQLAEVRDGLDTSHAPYVFGDDLIVRKSDYGKIRAVFEELSLKLSENKCCTGRFFRESCGMDAFHGVCVTPVRLRSKWSDRLSPRALLSWVAYANAFSDPVRGYKHTSEYIRSCILQQRPGLPSGARGCVYPLAFHQEDGSVWSLLASGPSSLKLRFDTKLHRLEVKLEVPYTRTYKCVRDGWSALHESVHRLSLRSNAEDWFGFDPKLPLGEYPVPHHVGLRFQWVPYWDLLEAGSTAGGSVYDIDGLPCWLPASEGRSQL